MVREMLVAAKAVMIGPGRVVVSSALVLSRGENLVFEVGFNFITIWY